MPAALILFVVKLLKNKEFRDIFKDSRVSQKSLFSPSYCVSLHDKLNQLRDEFNQLENSKFLDEYDEKLENQEKLEQQKQAEMAKREQEKVEIYKYQIEAKLAKTEKEALRQEFENAKQQEILARKPVNQKRVNHRVGLRNQKLAAEKQKLEVQKLEQAEKQKNLAKIRNLVNQELKLNKITTDSNRLKSNTKASSTKTRKTVVNQLTGEKIYVDHPTPTGLFPLKTFDDKKIMSDKRVKLTSLLLKAGIDLNNNYARSVFKNMQPAHQKHNFSNIFGQN